MKLVQWNDWQVTLKAKKMLKKAEAMQQLGLPFVGSWQQDDGETETLITLVNAVKELSGYVLELSTSGAQDVNQQNVGSFHSGRYMFFVPN